MKNTKIIQFYLVSNTEEINNQNKSIINNLSQKNKDDKLNINDNESSENNVISNNNISNNNISNNNSNDIVDNDLNNNKDDNIQIT